MIVISNLQYLEVTTQSPNIYGGAQVVQTFALEQFSSTGSTNAKNLSPEEIQKILSGYGVFII
jgi:hypothetical protein